MGKLFRVRELSADLSSSHREVNPTEFLGVGKLVEIPQAKMIHEILCRFVKKRTARNFGAAGNLDESAIEQRLHDAIDGNASNGFNVGACDGLAVGNDCERFEGGCA